MWVQNINLCICQQYMVNDTAQCCSASWLQAMNNKLMYISFKLAIPTGVDPDHITKEEFKLFRNRPNFFQRGSKIFGIIKFEIFKFQGFWSNTHWWKLNKNWPFNWWRRRRRASFLRWILSTSKLATDPKGFRGWLSGYRNK